MMARPWAKATAVMPLRPAPPPITAAAPAPMNTNEKVPMNSARSLGAIGLDIVDSRDEMTIRRDQVSARERYVCWEWPTALGSAAGRRSEQAYSAAIICDLKSMPSAFATPAPYAGSALAQLAMCRS